tara:strand:+ start:3464 stop:4318 length:855 start_codon:yes stop_codon:yes gene_type:complete
MNYSRGPKSNTNRKIRKRRGKSSPASIKSTNRGQGPGVWGGDGTMMPFLDELSVRNGRDRTNRMNSANVVGTIGNTSYKNRSFNINRHPEGRYPMGSSNSYPYQERIPMNNNSGGGRRKNNHSVNWQHPADPTPLLYPGLPITGNNNQPTPGNNLHQQVMNWISQHNTGNALPNWSMWSGVTQRHIQPLINSITMNVGLKQNIINETMRGDWRQITRSVENMIKRDSAVSRVYENVMTTVSSSSSQNNDSNRGSWSFGIKCRGCAWDESCCWLVAAAIVLLILL